MGKLQYRQLKLSSYKAGDSTFKLKYKDNVFVEYDKRYRIKYTMNSNGMILLLNEQRPKDAIYQKVTLLSTMSDNLKEKTYINVSLLFENVKDLNRMAKEQRVINQQMIPLAFTEEECFELEFANYEVN